MDGKVIEIDDDSFESCPVCESLVCRDLLTKHVEMHFKTYIDVKEWRLCQKCGNKVPDSEWGDHNYAHGLEDGRSIESCNQKFGEDFATTQLDRDERMFCETNVDERTDEMLAHTLQQEEKEEMKKKKQNEQKEFQKLQTLYGMSSGFGYVNQYYQSMDKDVARNKMSIADYYSGRKNILDEIISGEDSRESCTQGIINKLQKEVHEVGPGNQVLLLCYPTDHFASTCADKGWGCGYRNLQMLFSSLLKADNYRAKISAVCKNVPSIPKIQQIIEDAWHEGFDLQGAAQLGNILRKTRKWIGATEIAVALRYIGLRAHIVDFHQPTATDGTHFEMFAWIKQYFKRNLNKLTSQTATPIYIQQQGHSRLVIGFEEKFNKNRSQNILLFDPSHSKRQMETLLQKEMGKYIGLTLLRKSPKQMKAKQYQIVYVDGIMSHQERVVSHFRACVLFFAAPRN